MIFAAIGCLSLSSIAYELLITRFFSIAHWSHLSFLAVGVAMFGYAAGAAFFFLRGDRRGGRAFPSWLLPAGSLTTIGSFLAVKALPLDYLRFPLDPWQPAYLLLACILLSLPFLASGFASCAAYAGMPQRSGTISFASFLGGAAGAVAPALLLPFLAEGGCVAAVAGIPLVAAVALGPGGRLLRSAAGLAAAGLAALAAANPGLLSVEPSSYKTLPLLLQAPATRVMSRESGLRGRLEEVQSPQIRFSPGLSLAFTGSLPAQRGLIVDGDSLNVLYDLRSPGATEFARWTHSFAAYAVGGQGGSSLVLQADGGLGLACAVAAGSRRIVLVTEDPRIARRMGQWYQRAGVSVVAENPRTYLAGTQERFSTIAIDDWGPSIPGMASLSEDAFLTTDALLACLARLAEGGVLEVSRRLVLPPSDSLRLFATALDALRRGGLADPALHVAAIRSWDSSSIILSRDPLAGKVLDRLVSFARSRSFDLDYYPGMDPALANRFSRYDRPIFAEAYRAIVRDPGFTGGLDLDVAPQGDDRPFPSHFVKWTRIGSFQRATGHRIYTLLLTGEVVAGAAFLESLVLCAALVALTFLLGRRMRQGGGGPTVYVIVALSGIGFMAIEMFVIDGLAPLFPSATVALSIALGGLLFFSALGGLASERIGPRMLFSSLIAGAAVIVLLSLLFPDFLRRTLGLGFAPRVAAAIGMMAVPGFLIGIPFAASVRMLAGSARERASAWAVNGCASVAVSFASALVAPAAGIRTLAIAAAGAYALCAVVLHVDSSRRRPYYPGP